MLKEISLNSWTHFTSIWFFKINQKVCCTWKIAEKKISESYFQFTQNLPHYSTSMGHFRIEICRTTDLYYRGAFVIDWKEDLEAVLGKTWRCIGPMALKMSKIHSQSASTFIKLLSRYTQYLLKKRSTGIPVALILKYEENHVLRSLRYFLHNKRRRNIRISTPSN